MLNLFQRLLRIVKTLKHPDDHRFQGDFYLILLLWRIVLYVKLLIGLLQIACFTDLV